MAGRRNRRTGRRKSRLQPLREEEEEAWTQPAMRTMRRNLVNMIHRYYLDAISRLPAAELRATLARGLFVGGHCLGPLHPVGNIIVNSVWYAAASPSTDADALISADGIARICHRSLDGLLAYLRHCCPSLSTGDALCQLASAIALANGTKKSSAQRAMASQGRAPFHLAATAACHPNPDAFARFSSSLLPAANVRRDLVQFLLMLTSHNVLSAEDINSISKLLLPPLKSYPPPLSRPPVLTPQALDRIATQKKQFKDTGKQVLHVVNMALQEYTLRSGERLMLHSVCGASLLEEKGLENCYHINFMAHRKASGDALGAPLLFFTEAIILACNGINIRSCVPVDPVTDIGCCFACETNKKKVVHPLFVEYLGGREFQVDEVDYGGVFLNPLDVDYIFFDADTDKAFATYMDESTDV